MVLDTLLLLGLPASGKSVVGRYLASAAPELDDLGVRIGPAIHLDDFHYVRAMWRVCQAIVAEKHDPVFLEPDSLEFLDPREWETLIHLVNEDYAALLEPEAPLVGSRADWLVDRMERAHSLAGMSSPFSGLAAEARRAALIAVGDDAARFADEFEHRGRPPGSTVVIEFSRGGPAGAELPLDPPYGYAHALSHLSAQILERAVVLYVYVTPEESRRRNRERAQPSAEGSASIHSVPETVMDAYYGTDDMPWLIDHAERRGTIAVRAHGTVFHLPVAVFDNRRPSRALRRGPPARSLDASVRSELRRALSGLDPGTRMRGPGA